METRSQPIRSRGLIVLSHNGGRLANQLWLLISTLAYALEKGFSYRNYSFHEYQRKFSIRTGNILFDYIFCHLPLKIRRALYGKYIRSVEKKHQILKGGNIIERKNPTPFYLTPSLNSRKEHKESLSLYEKKEETLYFSDWLFRNPKGIEKYRATITSMLKPNGLINKKVTKKIEELRKTFKYVIGVHLRQGDYKKHPDTSLWWSEKEVFVFLKKYLEAFGYKDDNTVFLITSDEPVDKLHFKDLNVSTGLNDEVADLFLLSKSDIIIGSNSSFGTMASYLGNIPFIMLEKEDVDWHFYKNRSKYFENPKATMTCY